jgi:4-amino-4-deoxy-L-arabinose transferase-like glycosyltransferase
MPGLHDDEAIPACSTIDLLKGKPSSYSPDITFLGMNFPLMAQAQDAGAASYFLLPFLFLLKIDVFSLRLTPIFFGALTLILTYLFSRRAFDRGVAMLSTFLLAISPYFISAVRVGGKYNSYTAFFAISSVYYLFRWYKEGHLFYFLIGLFLLGVGCSTSWWFNGYLISLLLSAFIFRQEIKPMIQSSRIKLFLTIILGTVSFCVGNFLFICANFINSATRFLTFKVMFKNFPYAAFGVHKLNNLEFVDNFYGRLNSLIQLLGEGDLMTRHIIGVKSNFIYPIFFLMAVLWLVFLFRLDRIPTLKKRKSSLLLILMSIAVLMSSVYGITEFGSYQLLFLVPFIHIIAALGAFEFIRFFKSSIARKVSLGIVCLCLSISTVINLCMFKNYFNELQITGGHASWSKAIYELAGWINKNNHSNIAAFGYAHSLYFLTQGNVYAHDFDILWRQKAAEELFANPNTLYIFDDERPDLMSYVSSLYEVANLKKKDFVKIKEFFRMDNAPIEVYVLK